jgi:sulfoxide reductase heme-binding subunit YedZ
VGAVANTLGANPAEALIRGTGDWTLRFLCLTLAVTPLRQARLAGLARLRRMLGLFAFFYGVLHFLCFAWLDMGLDLDAHREGHPQAARSSWWARRPCC